MMIVISMKSKKILFITLLILLFSSFLFVLVQVQNGTIEWFDDAVYSLVYRSDTLTDVVKVVTFLGDKIALITITLLLVILIKNKRTALMIPCNLFIVAIVNTVIKMLVCRPRPIDALMQVDGYSFPSGHSTGAVAFYGLLVYLIYKNVKNKGLRSTLMVFLILLIFAIGLSRIYLRVHYPSDVLGGFLLGSMYLIVYIFLYEKYILDRR